MDSVLRRVFILNWKWAAFGMTALRNWHLWWGCFEVARFLFTMTGSMLPKISQVCKFSPKIWPPSSSPFSIFLYGKFGAHHPKLWTSEVWPPWALTRPSFHGSTFINQQPQGFRFIVLRGFPQAMPPAKASRVYSKNRKTGSRSVFVQGCNIVLVWIYFRLVAKRVWDQSMNMQHTHASNHAPITDFPSDSLNIALAKDHQGSCTIIILDVQDPLPIHAHVLLRVAHHGGPALLAWTTWRPSTLVVK